MASRAVLSALGIGVCAVIVAAVPGSAASADRSAFVARAAEALGGAAPPARREDDHRGRLRRDRLHERRRQHLGVPRRAAEVGQRPGLREDHRPRARPDAGAAAQSSELRLRRPGGLSRRAEPGGRRFSTATSPTTRRPNGRPVRASDQAARARRLDMLNNPVALVRAALDPSARGQQRPSRGIAAACRHHACRPARR